MPDIVMHNWMGKSVFNRLELEIAASIDYDIFRLAVMGPDPFIYYRFFAPPLRHNHNRISSVMHSEHTGCYLVELAKRTREDKSKELFSYLAGFLCHYSLDGKTHPAVNRLSGNDMHKHLAIERKLDQIVLQKQGKILKDRPITNELFPSFLPESLRDSINRVMEEVYGWKDSWKLMKTSYRHMKWYHYIMEDPSGTFDNSVGRVVSKVKGLSYHSNLYELESYDWFWPILEDSIDEAVDFIEHCFDFVNERMSEKELTDCIGNRSYSTGETLAAI